ncbi:MAG: phosphoglycerate kinase, partial [Deinococcus sp.]|nr:phosphoglycerate kinase [Deinococcus sp.]
MERKTVRDIDLTGKRVLMRVDFNVPLQDGKVTEDTRIRESLPTIRYVLDHKCAVILMSHLGRPNGQVVEGLRLAPVARHLGELLKRPVTALPIATGPSAEAAARYLAPGQVLMLENLRFDPREEQNDPDMAQELAKLGEVYVNDAFGTAHRAHASTAGIAKYLPAVAGLLMEKELKVLGTLLEAPQQPFILILGGAKISTKIGVLDKLLPRLAKLLIGGGMAYTFLKAQG